LRNPKQQANGHGESLGTEDVKQTSPGIKDPNVKKKNKKKKKKKKKKEKNQKPKKKKKKKKKKKGENQKQSKPKKTQDFWGLGGEFQMANTGKNKTNLGEKIRKLY